MTEGQLKKRMGSLTQQPEEWVTEDMDTGTSDRTLVNLGATLSIIAEAKKDIYYHLSFDDYKDVKVPYDEIQDLLDKIVKWFGDST